MKLGYLLTVAAVAITASFGSLNAMSAEIAGATHAKAKQLAQTYKNERDLALARAGAPAAFAGTDTEELFKDVAQANCANFLAHKRAAVKALGANFLRTLVVNGGDQLLENAPVGAHAQQPAGQTKDELIAAFDSLVDTFLPAAVAVAGPANGSLNALSGAKSNSEILLNGLFDAWADEFAANDGADALIAAANIAAADAVLQAAGLPAGTFAGRTLGAFKDAIHAIIER